jgi:hypothetical protein
LLETWVAGAVTALSADRGGISAWPADHRRCGNQTAFGNVT